ncbi:MAG: hypothetical protein ABI134_21340 [Byssovorax sp.]
MMRDGLSDRVRDHFDWPLFISAALIAVLGVMNLYSATSVYQGARSELYISQVQWLVVGGIIAGLVATWVGARWALVVFAAVGIVDVVIVLASRIATLRDLTDLDEVNGVDDADADVSERADAPHSAP